MQIGKHYSIKILGEDYYAVCVAIDEDKVYLQTHNGNLLEVSTRDEMAFQTVAETMKYQTELNKLFDKQIDKEFDQILEEAYQAKKLITSDTPLSAMAQGYEKVASHLLKMQGPLERIDELLKSQAKFYQEEVLRAQKEKEKEMEQTRNQRITM